MSYYPTVEAIVKAGKRIAQVVNETPLEFNEILSERYGAKIYLKREDRQPVRSYKIRGAFNKMVQLEDPSKGVICASAGNHAQGVAFSCKALTIKGTIVMPSTTPSQKVQQVKMHGGEFVQIILQGDTFDDAYNHAQQLAESTGATFIHPFNDPDVIEGQGTVGMEIVNQLEADPDLIIMPIGGGGLAAGTGAYLKSVYENLEIIGVEPSGAPAMLKSFEAGHVVTLEKIDKFVDGAAVQKVGEMTFPICQKVLNEICLVDEGKVCQTILEMYNTQAIVLEPAGSLSIAVLDQLHAKGRLAGKTVVCVLSGSNNDITRTAEIEERAKRYSGALHYFVVRFPQRAGALKEFVSEVLGPTDDIVFFQYSKKVARENGPAVVGVEIKNRADFDPLVERMKERGYYGEYLNSRPDILNVVV